MNALGITVISAPLDNPVTSKLERRLAFRNVHTNELCDALLARGGAFLDEGLAELDHALRDWRTGTSRPIDRSLLMLACDIRDTLGVSGSQRIDLISGYRSPSTNALLREHGGGGVATQSQHLLGKALDIAIPGVRLERLRVAAMYHGRGGVGFYPNDGFVHIDTARVRYW